LTARALVRKGRPDLAAAYVREGFARDSKTAKDILVLGDILTGNGFHAEAVEVLAVALQGELRKAEIYTKIGDAFAELAQPDRAMEEWRQGLEWAQGEDRDALMNRLGMADE
jgi:Flp pilus assembly protein TadD